MFENEYRKRINLVVTHIDANLGQALTLDELADVSGISKFHMHRLFHSFVGEPLAGFIRRQRLARGYRLNSDSGLGKGEVMGLGYRSMSSFIRAFRTLFGATPGQLAGNHGPTLTTQLCQTAESRQIVLMPDRVEAIQPAWIFGSLQRGYYNRGFEQTARRAFSTALKIASHLKISSSLGVGIGLVFDDPDFTDPDRMEFFGGFALTHPGPSIDLKPCELRPLQPGPRRSLCTMVATAIYGKPGTLPIETGYLNPDISFAMHRPWNVMWWIRETLRASETLSRKSSSLLNLLPLEFITFRYGKTMKRLVIAIGCVVLLLGAVTLMIPATRTATRVTSLPAARKDVFQLVTRIADQGWRPSVDSARVLKSEEGQEEWLEVSKDGHELLFKTIEKVEPELFEIEFSGKPSIRGRWSGRFSEQAENETRVEFTETVTAGSLPSKVLGYLFFDLDATLDTYINDLKNKLEGEGDEQASR